MLSDKVIAAIVIASVIFGQAPAQGAGLPGDYNGDWNVDSSDYVTLRKSGGNYTAWRQNFSASATTNGDYNGDWKVDASDYVTLRKSGGNYTAWRQNFSASATTNGDYNGDWKVDASDYVTLRKSGGNYTTWRQNFNASGATNGVKIPAGADIQSYINAYPANTIFYIAAGERRLTSALTPKDGDAFVGAPGTILNGSKLLTSFTSSSGKWYATGQTQQGSTNGGECLSGYSSCANPEDVYLDNKPLLHVDSLSKVGPGKWYFDYSADRIYLGDNPAGHKVETSVTSKAFAGNSSIKNVAIYGLTVEKFATLSSSAAIDSGDGAGWLVDKSEVRLNHAVGVELYNGTIRNSFLHHNGQTGAQDTNGIDGGTALVEGNEISFNNFAGYNYNWEAGGIKFAVINGLTVRNNNVHDNFGQGIWDDIDSTNVLYEGNTVTNNYSTGILHEIGGKAIIRNNVVKNNSPTHYSDAGGQIVVYSSDHTEVYGNTVATNSPANAIIVIQELREGGHYSHDNYIHNNTTTLVSGAAGNGNGLSGMARFDSLWPTNANNRFDYNTYYAPDTALHWQWPDDQSWSVFKLKGNEAHGQLFTTPSFSASAIPEPSTCVILISSLILFTCRRSRH